MGRLRSRNTAQREGGKERRREGMKEGRNEVGKERRREGMKEGRNEGTKLGSQTAKPDGRKRKCYLMSHRTRKRAAAAAYDHDISFISFLLVN